MNGHLCLKRERAAKYVMTMVVYERPCMSNHERAAKYVMTVMTMVVYEWSCMSKRNLIS